MGKARGTVYEFEIHTRHSNPVAKLDRKKIHGVPIPASSPEGKSVVKMTTRRKEDLEKFGIPFRTVTNKRSRRR